MPRANQPAKRKRRRRALPALGAAGLSSRLRAAHPLVPK